MLTPSFDGTIIQPYAIKKAASLGRLCSVKLPRFISKREEKSSAIP
jgi:hypothetical protein